jgi:autotransporter-associated beta strand protein
MKTTDLIKDSLNHSSWRRGFLLIPLGLAPAWKSFHGKNIQSPLRSLGWAFLPSAAAILTLLLSTASSSFAGSATWLASPANTDWNSAVNWTAGGPPNGPADTATFATSNIRRPFIASNTEVNGIVFNPGASAFTIANAPPTSPTLTISGAGITNNSGIVQNFAFESGGAQIVFTFNATAGSLTAFTTTNITFGGTSTAGNATFTNIGKMNFTNTSTAGDATVTNGAELLFDGSSTAGNGTFTSPEGGIVIFSGIPDIISPTAGNGTFINPGGAVSERGGGFIVFNSATAGNATFTNNGGAVSGAIPGETLFNPGDADNATLIANGGLGGGDGGLIVFSSAGGVSTGGTARVEVFGNGNLDISQQSAPGLTTGSIEGDGLVFLGANKLTVGANDLSTTFSGLIQDGGIGGGTGGSLTKTGNGELSLTKANTYTGGTIVDAGTLLVKNETDSATGSGAVQVNAGTLGGTGKIAGAVTVGTGIGIGAFLSPGNSATEPGTLTIDNNTLTFNSASTYKCALDRTTVTVTQVAAKGVTIKSVAQFVFGDFFTTGTLTTGTVLTVINNTSASAIVGRFSNLPDRSIFASNGNNFQVSYRGGTGNDLTLTVVP